tara:strand:- start:145 stop:396 length:252 start_codon:yes stop_codon:yes gene_type:complete
MVQPIAPQTTATNASVTNVAVPPPTEQIKTSGIKPTQASSVTSTEEGNTTTPDNENQRAEESSIQRTLQANSPERGTNLDILV